MQYRMAVHCCAISKEGSIRQCVCSVQLCCTVVLFRRGAVNPGGECHSNRRCATQSSTESSWVEGWSIHFERARKKFKGEEDDTNYFHKIL